MTRALTYLLLFMVVILEAGCDRKHLVEPVRITVAYDAGSEAALWLHDSIQSFPRNLENGRRLSISLVSATYPEFLTRIGPGTGVDVLILTATAEKAFLSTDVVGLGVAHHLHYDPLVLVTTAGQEPVTQITQEHTVVQYDPETSGLGLATLILRANLIGLFKLEKDVLGQRVADIQRQSELLGFQPIRSLVGEHDPAEPLSSRHVLVVTQSSCHSLRRAGSKIRAAYPTVGTVVLDYPAFVPSWVNGDRRTAALALVEHLQSVAAEDKKDYLLGGQCAAGDPNRVLPGNPLRRSAEAASDLAGPFPK